MKDPGPGKPWRILGWLAAAAACAGYALLAHRAASAPAPGGFEAAVILAPLMALGLALAWRSAHRVAWLAAWLALAAALVLARGPLAAGTAWMLLLQHVGYNLALGLGFGRTLVRGSKPLVSRFAEIVHGPLSPVLARYTRGVTWAWTLYFGLTALASVLLFLLAPPAVWSGYVNLLSLPMLTAMFVAEYLVRLRAIPASERSGFFQAVGAYRQFIRRKAAGPH